MSTVVAAMAYWRAGTYVRRAVESILAQTHGDLLCVVVNDADDVDPPWPHLTEIDDPRLVRFDLDRNRGRYFIDAVIFEALEPAWWALADPDDHSHPSRFEVALEAQREGVALGPWYIEDVRGKFVRQRRTPTRFDWPPLKRDRLRMRGGGGYGAGIISGERVADAGGFHPGFRVAWDTLLVSAVRLRGGSGTFTRALATKTVRDGSLTTTPETNMLSPYRREQHTRRLALWHEMWDRHHAGLDVASVVARDSEPWVDDVRREAARLRATARGVAA